MKYKKNKLRLTEIASAIQCFYFLVKFGLVLIYKLKVYRKKYSSILLRKNMFNFSCTFSSFQRFLCWKSRNYSQQFSVKILFLGRYTEREERSVWFVLYPYFFSFFFFSFCIGIFLNRYLRATGQQGLFSTSIRSRTFI